MAVRPTHTRQFDVKREVKEISLNSNNFFFCVSRSVLSRGMHGIGRLGIENECEQEEENVWK